MYVLCNHLSIGDRFEAWIETRNKSEKKFSKMKKKNQFKDEKKTKFKDEKLNISREPLENSSLL